MLSTELKRKLATVKRLKASVSRVSPSSERLEEFWVVCGLICSYAIGGNIAKIPGKWQQFATRINEMKYSKKKRDLPSRNDFKIFQQIAPVEIIFMKLLVVYLHCT